MPHITRCVFHDLVGRPEPLVLELNRHVNVFFGANGSGKTSLLRLLHSALSNDSKQLSKFPVLTGFVHVDDVALESHNWVYNSQGITRAIELKQQSLFPESARPLRALAHPPRELKIWTSHSDVPDSGNAEAAIPHVYLPITRLYATDDPRHLQVRRSLDGQSNLSEDDLDRFFVESINLLWLRYTRNLLAEIRSAQQVGLTNILYNLLAPESAETEAPQIENPDLAYRRLTSFLHRQDSHMLSFFDEDDFAKRLGSSGLMRNVVSDIERVEERVEIAQRPRNQFERLIREMTGNTKTFELSDTDIKVENHAGRPIGLGNLSSGEKQLLRICLEALFAGDNPIIIDEPELSMHIDWQRKLIRSLRLLSPASQIIVATHSPEIMADLSEDMIFEL